jgi:hypothetical protein
VELIEPTCPDCAQTGAVEDMQRKEIVVKLAISAICRRLSMRVQIGERIRSTVTGQKTHVLLMLVKGQPYSNLPKNPEPEYGDYKGCQRAWANYQKAIEPLK